MNAICRKSGGWVGLIGILLSITLPAQAELIQPVSLVSSNQTPPAGGNGDSGLPILSQDGRYVIFSSTANNLGLLNHGAPIPMRVPARFNVFLRDRTNQTTTLISLNMNGTGGGNGNSFPVTISTNGQLALFESSASDLIAADTNQVADVFVRDLAGGTTLLVSTSTNGLPANGASRSAVMTPDGRFVAFVSEGSDLVPNDTNHIADVFVRDLQTSATTLVSVGAMSTNPAALVPVSSSDSPQITPDGRWVAFSSTATNLVPGGRTVGDIYVRDLIAGTTVWASSGMRTNLQSVTGKTNGICYNLALSADGKFVAYQASLSPLAALNYSGIILRYGLDTAVTDLVHTNAPISAPAAESTRNLDLTPDGRLVAFVASTNGVLGTTTCVQVWDASTGLTALASGDLADAVPANSISTRPVIDPSGRYVAFLSSTTNLTANAIPGPWHIYLRDLQTATTTLVDADTNGVGSPVTFTTVPSLSADARFIAFECADGGLVPNDNNRNQDVFVRDLVAGTNELISVGHPSLASATPNNFSLLSAFSASADGRYIAFASEADNLVPGDTNGFRDVFVRDLASDTTLLVSADPNGVSGNGISAEPAISGDGRYVAFTSSATNLVAGDVNQVTDVFVRDLSTGTTLLASRKINGSGPGNKASYSPVLSADGRWLLFRSKATDLASGSFTGIENLFLRDMESGTNWALTSGTIAPAGAAAMTPDGRFIAFIGAIPGNSGGYVYVWDSHLSTRVFTNNTAALNLAISADGNRLAYNTLNQLSLADRAAQTNWLVTTFASNSHRGPRLSATGDWLCYSRFESPWHQTFLYDVQNRTEQLVSHARDSSTGGAGDSDSPDLSPDGRFVAYRTLATNVVNGATGITWQIVLYDRQTGSNTLVSASRFNGGPADDHSLRANFSPDGQTLLIQSWASDLVANDFNHSGDVLARTILTAVILPSVTPGQGPWLYWPFVPGNNYRVQFKNHLADPLWQNLPGSITNIGVKAWLQDITPAGPERFYRVISF